MRMLNLAQMGIPVKKPALVNNLTNIKKYILIRKVNLFQNTEM